MFHAAPFQFYPPQPEPAPAAPPPLPLTTLRDRLCAMATHGWRRLTPDCDDFLNMLYDHAPATQWTLGWGPQDGRLYLLLWRKDAWRADKRWQVWVDGVFHAEWPDLWRGRESRLCREAMEGRRAEALSASAFLQPLSLQNLDADAPMARYALSALSRAMQAHPFIWNGLKEALFETLEAADWTEATPLQRQERLLPLVAMMTRAIDAAPEGDESDRQRLEAAVRRATVRPSSLASLFGGAIRRMAMPAALAS